MEDYIFQKKDYHSFQCGAYAIYNLLKKSRVTINLNTLIEGCKARKDIGTLVSDFNKTITELDLNIKQLQESDINIKKIKELLHMNKQIIILFHWTQDVNKGNHYAVIDQMYCEYGNYKYRIINYSFDKTVHIVSERELKSLLLSHTDEYFNLPVLWSRE